MSYEFDPIDETLLGELEEVVAELTQYTDEPIPKLWSRERGMKDIRLFRERGPYPVDGNPIEVGTEGVRETIQQLRMHPDERERLFFARAIGIKRFFFVPQTIATREDGTKLPRRSPGEMLRYIAPMLKDAADFIKDGYDPVSGQKLMKVKHTERTPEGAVFMARRGEGMAYLDAQLQIVL